MGLLVLLILLGELNKKIFTHAFGFFLELG